MSANRKRSQRPKIQPGNQTRTEWAAGPPPPAAAAAGGSGGGGDGDGVDSPADFPYNLCDRKPGEQSQQSGLGKIRLVPWTKTVTCGENI